VRYPDDGRVEGERLGLRGSGLLESLAAHEATGDTTAVEGLNVMQTARRTGTSIGQAFDNDVALLDYVLEYPFWCRFSVRWLLEPQHSVALDRE